MSGDGTIRNEREQKEVMDLIQYIDDILRRDPEQLDERDIRRGITPFNPPPRAPASSEAPHRQGDTAGEEEKQQAAVNGQAENRQDN